MKNFANRTWDYIKSDFDRFLIILLIFVLPFERIPSVDILGASLRPSVVIGLLVIARAIYKLLTKQIKFKFNLEYKLLVIFVIWILLLVPISINIFRGVSVLLFDFFTISLAISISLIFNKKYLRPIIYSLLLSASLMCIFAIFQYFGNLFGLPNSVTGLREAYTWSVFGFPRVHAASLEPLYFAAYLLLPFCITFLCASLKNNKLVGQKLSYFLLALFSMVIFMTVSRGAIYAMAGTLIVGAIFLIWLGLSDLTKILKSLLMIVVAAGLSLLLINFVNKPPSIYTQNKQGASAYLAQLSNTSIDDNDGRALARQKAVQILKNDRLVIIFGLGPGQYGPYSQNNIPKDGKWTIVNNLALEVLVELGAVGLAILVIFVVTLLMKGVKTSITQKGQDLFILVFGLCLYIFSQAIQYQGYSTLYVIYIWVPIGLLMGLIIKTKLKKNA